MWLPPPSCSKGCISVAAEAIAITESRSGLNVTAPVGIQLRISRDQRAGLTHEPGRIQSEPRDAMLWSCTLTRLDTGGAAALESWKRGKWMALGNGQQALAVVVRRYYDEENRKEAPLSETTLTSKGQVTVPREIRERLGLASGDKLTFTLLSDGTVIMRAKTRRLLDLAGSLTRPGQPKVTIEQMNPFKR